MKTIEDLKKIISENQKFIEKQRELKVTKGIKPASKKIKLCNTVISYLESNPKEEWLKNCCTESNTNKQRLLFNKENGITRKRQQIRFINFILNK